MDLQNLIYFLALGAIAGWIGGQIMKGAGFVLIGNIVVGVVGSVSHCTPVNSEDDEFKKNRWSWKKSC